MRRPAARTSQKPRIAKNASFPAPVGGWIKNQNLAAPGARNPDGSSINGAFLLDNWFPTATGVRMRAGTQLFATVGNGSGPATSMFAYVNGNLRKLFASTATAIYDISSPASPTVSPTADVASLTGGNWSVVQTATPGGIFLRAVNGADTPLVYDGSGWATTPVITGVTGGAATLSHVWVFKQRTFFIKKDSLSAYYLPVDTIGGAAVELPLGGVFKRGGSLLFGATWSIESGNGPAEYCVFVSTEGEAAVYSGTDPSVAANWTKVGVYRIGKPLGARASVAAGGDLVIATDIGFVPLSLAIQRDFSVLSPAAISFKIETAWNDAVAAKASMPWCCEVWPTKQMVVVALPTGVGDTAEMFVTNARTGAWGRYTGWNGTCLQLFNDRLFFGSTAGHIIEAEVTGSDLGIPYTATCVPQFDSLKAPASLKTSQLMRAQMRAAIEVVPRLSLQSDFEITLPSAPDDTSQPGTGVWGAGIWGTSKWGVALEKQIFMPWQSVGGSGYAIAPGIQITSGTIVPPDAELVQVDMTYDQGDIAS